MILNGIAANFLQQTVLSENKNHSGLAVVMPVVELRPHIKHSVFYTRWHAGHEVEIYVCI